MSKDRLKRTMLRLSYIFVAFSAFLVSGCSLVEVRQASRIAATPLIPPPPQMVYAGADQARYPEAAQLVGRSRDSQMPSTNAVSSEIVK